MLAGVQPLCVRKDAIGGGGGGGGTGGEYRYRCSPIAVLLAVDVAVAVLLRGVVIGGDSSPSVSVP